MDDVTTEVLRIIIEAQDRASETLKQFGNHVDGAADHVSKARIAFGALGLVAAGALIGSIKAASDFATQMNHLQNNTTLTDGQMQGLRGTLLDMAQRTAAPLDQLANGMMHITNFGYSGADAVRILNVAMQSAESTGGDTGKVADVLAAAMHEFGLNASQAAGAMDVLHLASARGNTTLDAFVGTTAKAMATAANLGVPLTDVSAALSALTNHGIPIAQAGTLIAGALSKIANPAKGTVLELKRLSKATGIDLVYDFSAAGLKAKGLSGVMDDLKRATGGNVQELFKLIPATRGGQAAMILAGNGARDYHSTLRALTDTMAGRTNPTADAYARTQKTLGFEVGVLKNNVQVLAITLGTALLPPLTRLVGAAVPIAQAIVSWARAHQTLAPALLGAIAAVGLLVGGLAPLGLALSGMGVIVGPLAAVLGGLSLPLLAVGAAVAGLAIAWQRDWGGIREKTASAWAALQPAFAAIGAAIGKVRTAFGDGNLGAAAQEAWTQVKGLTGQFLGWLGGTGLPALKGQLDKWATALWSWIKVAAPVALREMGSLTARLGSWLKDTALPGLVATLASWGSALVAWVQPRILPLIRELAALFTRLNVWILTVAAPALVAKLAELGVAVVSWVAPRVPGLIAEFVKLNLRLVTWFAITAVPAMAAATLAVGQAVVQGVIDGIGGLGPTLLRTARALFDSLVGGVKGFLGIASPSTVFRDIGISTIQGMIDGIKSLGGGLITAGRDAMAGLASGIKSAGGGVIDAGKHVASGLVGGVKGLLHINSPSLVFEEIGRGIMEGLQLGIAEHGAAAIAAVQAVGGAVLSAFAQSVGSATIGAASTAMHAAGTGLMAGLAAGIAAGTGEALAAVGTVGGAVLSGMAAALGASPGQPAASTVALGESLMAGVAAGIAAGTPAAAAAMQQAVSRVSQAAQGSQVQQQVTPAPYATYTPAAGPPPNTAGPLYAGSESSAQASISQKVQQELANPDAQQAAIIAKYGKSVAAGIFGGMLRGLSFQDAYVQSVGPANLPVNASGAVTLPTLPPSATSSRGGQGGGTVAPIQPASPFGAAGGHTITVTVQAGAVQVTGGGTAAGVSGQQVGDAVARAISQLLQSAQSTSPGASSRLPGAI